MKRLLQTLFCVAVATTASAQLSKNPDKFLGNITTSYQVNPGGSIPNFNKLWNQITPENESKWGSVEGSRGRFNWGCDTPFDHARQSGFPFKFHAFLWGSQYPGFLDNMSIKDRYDSYIEWVDEVKKHYSASKWNSMVEKYHSALPMIDVVNEAIGMHQKGNPIVKTCAGGGGKTGYDWLIKSFELAYERFPGSILIYNDFNSFQNDVDAYITLVKTLRDAGAPIDAYGNQSHDVDNIRESDLKSVMKKQHDALMMPMYSSELDINIDNDTQQRDQLAKVFPLLWECDYCAGVTFWGYVTGRTWLANTGFYRNNGSIRASMTWLQDYMKTEKAKNVKSPFKNMRKEASIYIKPADYKVAKGDKVAVKVRVRMATEKVEKVDLYTGSSISTATTPVASWTEAPYICDFDATSSAGYKVLKAVVTTPDTTYVRYGGITVLSSTTKREPYNGTPFEIPGTIEIAKYDKGADGVTFHNASYTGSTRGTATATKDDGWMEYTVDVKEEGYYKLEAEVASAKEGGTFHLTEYGLDSLTFIAGMLEVPLTGSPKNYQKIYAVTKYPMSAGKHHLCLNVDKGGFYIKNITFRPYKQNTDIQVEVKSLSTSTITEGSSATIEFSASVKNNASTISSVVVYVNDEPIDTLTEAPYTYEFAPTDRGTYVIKAVAYDANGAENASANSKTLTVKALRAPFNGIIEIPGIIEAENFDHGDDNMTFHDSDTKDQGNVNYRTDNDGVDIVKGNGGYAIGYTANGEWLEYSVNVTKSGKYNCYATASATGDGAKFYVLRYTLTGASAVLWQFEVPKTGTYKTVEPSLIGTATTTLKQLTEGEQRIRIRIVGANCNIDKIELKLDEDTGIDDVENDLTTPWGTSYNLSGQKVGDGYRGIVIRNGKKALRR